MDVDGVDPTREVSVVEECPTCGGEGELPLDGPDDPRAEAEPTSYVDCRHCFGLAIAACDNCEGAGVVAVAVICLDCAEAADNPAA